jgi:hypothetical protein
VGGPEAVKAVAEHSAVLALLHSTGLVSKVADGHLIRGHIELEPAMGALAEQELRRAAPVGTRSAPDAATVGQSGGHGMVGKPDSGGGHGGHGERSGAFGVGDAAEPPAVAMPASTKLPSIPTALDMHLDVGPLMRFVDPHVPSLTPFEDHIRLV